MSLPEKPAKIGQKTAQLDRPLRILHLEDNPLDRQLVHQTLIGDKLNSAKR